MCYFSDKDLADRYRVKRQTIWRWARMGNLPKPVKLVGATRWRLEDIEAWESQQMEVAQ